MIENKEGSKVVGDISIIVKYSIHLPKPELVSDIYEYFPDYIEDFSQLGLVGLYCEDCVVATDIIE
jgi:hypothetical protein